jgi:hypothetical protein
MCIDNYRLDQQIRDVISAATQAGGGAPQAFGESQCN